jgi:hypothetical protein
MAVANATDRFAVLIRQGRRYQFFYRYETWVQYISRVPRERRDLAPLAAQLTEVEGGKGQWVYEGSEKLLARLQLRDADESTIAPDVFADLVIEALKGATPDWNPYELQRT